MIIVAMARSISPNGGRAHNSTLEGAPEFESHCLLCHKAPFYGP